MRVTLFKTAILLALLAWPAAASAQIDFSGEWLPVRSMDNTEDPWIGDWVGLPLNDVGRARAEAWNPSLLSLPEYQCRPHGWAYIYRGPTQLRISKEIDPFSREIVSYEPEWHQSTNMPVYLDGRDHPPEESAHTWGGFSSARWDGDMLRITTTHLKVFLAVALAAVRLPAEAQTLGTIAGAVIRRGYEARPTAGSHPNSCESTRGCRAAHPVGRNGAGSSMS